MKAAIIINQKAGKTEFTAEKLCDLLEREIPSDLFITNGHNIDEILDKIRWENYDLIIAAGGDGTISSVAGRAVKLKMKLGIIPAGTLNHFAKDLGIPLNPIDAINIIKKGKTELIDTAEVNGHLFLNNSSIGIYPQVVKRKKEEMKFGGNKWIAMIKAIFTVFQSIPVIEVKIQSDEKAIKCKIPFIFVGNNEYQMNLFELGRREKLNSGKLSVYYLNYSGRISYLKLLLKAIFGKLKQEETLKIFFSKSVTIYSKQLKHGVSLDGEVVKLNMPLSYQINPESLNIFVPD